MNLKQMFPGKYLGAIDLDSDIDVTIINISETEVTNEGQKEIKPIIMFKELDKPLILNKTNANKIAELLRSDETDDWIGKRVTLGVATVESFGKSTEAVRVRPKLPQQRQAQGAAARPATGQSYGSPRPQQRQDVEEVYEDEPPF
jgi:hypothetical protein